MSDAGQVTCAVCGADNPASAPVCQTCGRALPGLADRLFANDPVVPHAPTAGPPPNPVASAWAAASPPHEGTPPLPPPLPAASPDDPTDSLATWAGAATGQSGPPERPRSRVPLLVGAVVAVLVVAAAAYFLLGRDDGTDDAATTTSTPGATTTAAPTTSTTEASPPSAPTNLAVTADGPTSLAMTWIDTSDNEDGFVVARVRGDVVDEIADLPPNTAGYVVDGLEPETLYCLTVAGSNAATPEPAFVPEACAVTSP